MLGNANLTQRDLFDKLEAIRRTLNLVTALGGDVSRLSEILGSLQAVSDQVSAAMGEIENNRGALPKDKSYRDERKTLIDKLLASADELMAECGLIEQAAMQTAYDKRGDMYSRLAGSAMTIDEQALGCLDEAYSLIEQSWEARLKMRDFFNVCRTVGRQVGETNIETRSVISPWHLPISDKQDYLRSYFQHFANLRIDRGSPGSEPLIEWFTTR